MASHWRTRCAVTDYFVGVFFIIREIVLSSISDWAATVVAILDVGRFVQYSSLSTFEIFLCCRVSVYTVLHRYFKILCHPLAHHLTLHDSFRSVVDSQSLIDAFGPLLFSYYIYLYSTNERDDSPFLSFLLTNFN